MSSVGYTKVLPLAMDMKYKSIRNDGNKNTNNNNKSKLSAKTLELVIYETYTSNNAKQTNKQKHLRAEC